MAAKVKWDRGAWWVFTHYDGKRKKKRVGPTKADKREAEKIARQINAKLALGEFRPVDESKRESIPFAEIAESWLQREIEMPLDRSFKGTSHTEPRVPIDFK